MIPVERQLHEMLKKNRCDDQNVLLLKIFVTPEFQATKLHDVYKDAIEKHNQETVLSTRPENSFFDLFLPPTVEEMHLAPKKITNKESLTVDLGIQVAPYLYLSSGEFVPTHISLFPKEQSGFLMANVRNINADDRDNISVTISSGLAYEEAVFDHFFPFFDPVVQIIAPHFSPILVQLVDQKKDLEATPVQWRPMLPPPRFG